jgi:hypothetical protein
MKLISESHQFATAPNLALRQLPIPSLPMVTVGKGLEIMTVARISSCQNAR